MAASRLNAGTTAKWTRDEAQLRVAEWNAAREKAGAPGRLKVVGGLTEWRVIEVDVPQGEVWRPTPEEIEHEHAVVALYAQEGYSQAEFQQAVNRGDVKRRSDEIRRTQGLLRSNHKLPEPA